MAENTFMSLDPELASKVLEAAPTILYVYDVQKEHSVFQNRRFGELLGHPPSDEKSSEWVAFIHPEDAARFKAHRDRLKAIGNGETLFWEFRMRDANDSWRWFQSRDSLLSADTTGSPLLIVGSASEITEQKHSEERKELLAEEMRHRARNLVAVVQAIGRMSRPKDQPEVNRHLDAFMGRLMTLLNTGSIVLSSESRTADLETVAKTTLTAFGADGVKPRISTQGPAITLGERLAASLALAFHELATNAVKYGALSVDTGSVLLKWEVIGGKHPASLRIDWLEKGGPPASPPTAEGFGGLVIRQSVAREPAGQVIFDYAPGGLHCRFEFQLPSKF